MPLPCYRFDSLARLQHILRALLGGWRAMGVMLSAAGSLRWLRDTVASGVPFNQLSDEAASWEYPARGQPAVPALSVGRTYAAQRSDAFAARGSWFGLCPDRGAMARAVGVASALRDSLELLAALGDRPLVGRASGGGVASELWLRIVASTLRCAARADRGRGRLGLRRRAVGRAVWVFAGVLDDAAAPACGSRPPADPDES